MFGTQPFLAWVANRALAFSRDGSLLVTAGHPGGRYAAEKFQVWDFPSLVVRSNFGGFVGRLASATFAPDGQLLLTGTANGLLLVWNVAQGQVVERKGRWGRMFYGCRRYPECRFTAYHKPIAEPCPKCGRAYLLEKETKKEGLVVFCDNEDCGYERKPEGADPATEAAAEPRKAAKKTTKKKPVPA